MKALSIRQPWAWLIVNGYKDVENRTWGTRFRGRFLVHAGAKPDANLEVIFKRVWEEFHLHIPPEAVAQLGGIVGEAELVDCVTDFPSRWFSGPIGFTLRQARARPFRPMKGRLGFWEVEE